MNSQLVIQAVIVLASLVLGMMLYPRLVKTYTRLVTKLYKNLEGGSDKNTPDEPDKKTVPKEEIPSSVIGASKTVVGHSRTKAATGTENEKVIEKESIFATHTDETDENTEPMDGIDVPLEKISNSTEGEIDTENERLEFDMPKDAVQASGVSYDELMETGRVIAKERPADAEKDKAGRILYENRNTEMVEEMISYDEKSLEKINSLIRFHMKKHNLDVNTGTGIPSSETDDFENFDASSIF